MRKNLLYTMTISVAFSSFLLSCNNSQSGKDTATNEGNDCFANLTADEKVLVKKLISDMQEEKDSVGFLGNSSVYYYTNYFDRLREKKVEPVNEKYAQMLSRNYDLKRAQIERLLGTQMRDGKDATSVWVSADEFAPFFGQLLKYQFDSSTIVGMKIVFGAYPYNKQKDDEINPVTKARVNLDSLSGRSTVYFVGTCDTRKNSTDYFVTRHKEIKNLIIPIPVPSKGDPGDRDGFLNHGTLCPDSCTIVTP